MQERISQQLAIVVCREEDRTRHIQGSMPSQPRSITPLMHEHTDPEEATEPNVADKVHQSSRNILFQRFTGPETRGCHRWCICKCHVQRFFKSPWILESAIGRIAVHYSGQTPECNEEKCQGLLATPVTMTYFLPQYLLRRYITLTCIIPPLMDRDLHYAHQESHHGHTYIGNMRTEATSSPSRGCSANTKHRLMTSTHEVSTF